MLAGFLGSLLPEKRVLVSKVLEWVKAGFRQAQEAVSAAKDEVEAFRSLTQIERYLESDLTLLKGLLPITESEELVWLLHANLLNGKLNKHIRELGIELADLVYRKERGLVEPVSALVAMGLADNWS